MIVADIDVDKLIKDAGKALEGGQVRLRGEIASAIREAGLYMMRSVDNNFRAGGRPKWPALAASTVANRRQNSSKPLQDTGRLKQSITLKTGNETASIGTNLVYARVHQYGHDGIQIPDVYPRRAKALRWYKPGGGVVFAKKAAAHVVRIPARPYLVFQKADLTVLDKIFAGAISRAFKTGDEA